MKILDDGCICDQCPKSEELKKTCQYFLLTTGLQRAAAAAISNVYDGYAMRIEMVKCFAVTLARAEALDKGGSDV